MSLFAAYLRAYAASAAGMTEAEAEAGVAVEGALHLLRGLAGLAGGEPSPDALRSLALAHIERRLHDPAFGVEELHRALIVSRTRLYAAFSGGEGVAAAIRDARLDRAHSAWPHRRTAGRASPLSYGGAVSPTRRA